MKENMDVNLDSLIKKVQKEGVKKAEDLAEAIIRKAEDKASPYGNSSALKPEPHKQ